MGEWNDSIMRMTFLNVQPKSTHVDHTYGEGAIALSRAVVKVKGEN